MKHEPNFCEFRTMYDMVLERGFVGDPSQYYAAREAEAEGRLARGQRIAEGDLRYVRNEAEWYRLRRPTFRVYPAMGVALGSTRLEVPEEELKLPFRVFAVSFPPSTFFVDPSLILPLPGAAQALRGSPYLRAVLVSEVIVERESLTFRAIEMLIDIADDDPKANHEGRLQLILPHGVTVAESVEYWENRDTFQESYTPILSERRRLAATIAGVIFLAISKDRRYVETATTRVVGSDYCLCGSGLKFKKCCRRTKSDKGAPLGFAVGRGIDLPYRSSTATTVHVGDGRELEYGHIRSGHMRWQPKKDEAGEWVRELIFVAPTVVRPDLPLKPELTPRRIREVTERPA